MYLLSQQPYVSGYSVLGPVLGNVVSWSQDKASPLMETMTALRGTTKGCGHRDEQVIHSSLHIGMLLVTDGV